MKLWLDDEYRDPPPSDRRPPEGWIATDCPRKAIEYIATGEVEEMSLDNDLGLCGHEPPSEGRHVMDWLEKEVHAGKIPRIYIRIHTRNPVAAKAMRMAAHRCYAMWDARDAEQASKATQQAEKIAKRRAEKAVAKAAKEAMWAKERESRTKPA